MTTQDHVAIQFDPLIRRISQPPPYSLPKRLSIAHTRTNTTEHYTPLNNEERRLQYLDIIQELNAYYTRQNQLHNGVSRLLFGQEDDQESQQVVEENKIKFRYAFESCFLVQFKGIFLVFWLVIFIIVGIVSVVITDIPKGVQALWALLGIYVCITAVIHFRKYKEKARIRKLERLFRAQRREMMQQATLEQHVFSLPIDHYFEIQHDPKDHTHPVVTLLPPPPVYLERK